ncbi:MAG: VanW family protein [Acidobacteria bacterium]|nr:VanW family protein [Acidobacteriota bacterium]
MTNSNAPTSSVPTRLDSAVFRAKATLLQGRRFITDTFIDRPAKYAAGTTMLTDAVIAESATPLWTETEPEERFLVAGKIHNLRLAIRAINGVEIKAGETFSFWRQVGRAVRRRGYVRGRELREGCIIPNIGGGLCQLSNALYDAALQANFEIVERHAHTQVIAGSLAETGRDATVFWNYIDLRFRSPNPFRIEAFLDAEKLTVRFRGKKITEKQLYQISRNNSLVAEIGSCATCGVDDCHRVVKEPSTADFGKTAWLLDERTPEFDEYVKTSRHAADALLIPLDGKRFKKANYAWTTGGFSSIRQSLAVTAIRSYRSRKLSAQGAARQRNLLEMYRRLAESYAKKLSYDVLHVVVQQNLLPFLWAGGHLGGRTFDVLMSSLPMWEIQRRLDVAAGLHPQSTTLGDFRADTRLIEAEKEALANAHRIITPHTAVAEMFGEKADLLPWHQPAAGKGVQNGKDKPTLVFPASTVGRKGCYELREALKDLDVRLITFGPYIESQDFWIGLDVVRGTDDDLEKADLVVLPAFVEHRPRRLILAAASGIPVIASDACGVSGIAGISIVPTGDAPALRKEINRLLGSCK